HSFTNRKHLRNLSSLVLTVHKWLYMVGPTSTMARLREKREMPRTELPPAKNIKLEKRKDKRE
ncbi:hypothetical protein, partial [Brevibacillus sp. HD1.4A]|uniref:hypothetical protein n=1 Tax=Brevibacillus sp. HD1.4A TaxID=2738978 RepID=UPI001C2BD1A0